jgi:hypothetical protein
MFLATVIVGSIVAVLYLAAGIPKVTQAPKALAQARELSIAPRSYTRIGILEVLGAGGVVIGLRLPWIGVAAAGGLVLMMVGAVIAHLRAGQSPRVALPAIIFAALVIGYLRTRILSA